MERAMAKRAVATAVPDPRRESVEKQAHDIGEARKALDSATNIARGLWFTFLTLTLYLVITVGTVSHRDLFLETPLKLPVLNVDVPLVTFFGVAPVLFLIIHAYLLLNLKFMADNASGYFGALDELGLEAEAKRKLYLQLTNFLVLQMLIVRRQEKWGLMGLATHLAVVLTITIIPLMLLLLIQLQFLPYHSEPVTFIHRAAILADMILLIIFWSKIPGLAEGSRISTLRSAIWPLMVVTVIPFSGCVATFPGEFARENSIAELSGAAQYLLHSRVHEVKGKRELWLSDTLVLTDADFVSGDEDKVPASVTVSLRGRDLVGAYLARTDLRGADFTGANLSGANFRDAKLHGAQFGCPVGQLLRKERSFGNCTNLGDASLDGAILREAKMRQVRLQNATLSRTVLDNANLEGAQAQGAIFSYGSLLNINMSQTDLTGVKFENSNISNAIFTLSTVAGTSFQNVSLRGSDFTDARLRAPVFINVNVREMKAGNVDWTSTLVQSIKDSASAFVINQPAQPLNTNVSAARPAQNVNEFSVAGVELETTDVKGESVLATIEGNAVISRGDGDIEQDTRRWQPRLDKLYDLMCGRNNAIGADAVFSRLSSLVRGGVQPNAKSRENDMLLAFGPDSKQFIDKLFDPQCKNAAALEQNVCFALAYWSGDGSTPRKECAN
jgi:uncharacterized protein YjbI with pentapeptide repeats